MKISDRFRSHFIREILLPLIAVLAITFLAASFTVYWATSQSNQEALKVQKGIVHTALQQSKEEMRQQQQSLTLWQPLRDHLNTPSLDNGWMDENIGGWLADMFGHQLIYVLDAQQQVRYRWEQPAQAGSGIAAVQQLARRWQDEVQGTARLQRVALMRLADRPALVAISAVGRQPVPGGNPLLVSIRFIDDGWLNDLASRSHLTALTWSSPGRESLPAAHVRLRDSEGNTLGFLHWQADQPGTRMLHFIGPLVFVIVVVITLICGMMLRRLWRSSQDLSSTLLQLSASEAQAQHIAFHDVLTGLPNRALIEDQLNHALQHVQPSAPLALLLLDLDRFKNVNDTFGHHAGDDLIIEVAHRLLPLIKPEDTVGRLGGDEFVVLWHADNAAGDPRALCEAIIEALSRPFTLMGSEAWVGVSIGVALAPTHASERQEMMRKADIALYEAKHLGRGQFCLFAPRMDETVKTRQQMAADLRHALAEGQLAVWYQPLMNIDGSQVLGLEALLRWPHPWRGQISPSEFVPIAEETGLIVQLGEWVLREACRVARLWPELSVAVNVSPIQFRSSGFVERISAIVRDEGGNPQQIELEITEGVLLEDADEARTIIEALRRAGFRIALDDFGTGYSSLNYLSHFQVDKIKIDRSFIQSLGVNHNASTIIESVVKLGHAMGLTVTAEGVETHSQMSALAEAGCNQLQGFLFSQAVPQQEIAALMTSRQPG